MGWLWKSSSPDKVPTPPVDTESAPPPTSTPTSNSSTSNQSSDPEIEKFLDLLNTKSEPSKTASSQKPSDQSSIASWLSMRSSSSTSQSATEAPVGSAIAESLLPTEMSCRQAFDQAWACNSMGGQWNAVYRYGEMRSCSEHWDDFWFCMRIKSHGQEMRENLVRAHYRNKEYAKYGPNKPSSEDIWQTRDEKVEPGSVFTEPIE